MALFLKGIRRPGGATVEVEHAGGGLPDDWIVGTDPGVTIAPSAPGEDSVLKMIAAPGSGDHNGSLFRTHYEEDGVEYGMRIGVYGDITTEGSVGAYAGYFRGEEKLVQVSIQAGAAQGNAKLFSLTDVEGQFLFYIGPLGEIVAPALPTSDPANAGQLWNDAGTLKVRGG